MLAPAVDRQTPTQLRIQDFWGVTLCHWVSIPQHLEDFGAFIFKTMESRILEGLMALESKCTMIF
jgi:hypothetical protein